MFERKTHDKSMGLNLNSIKKMSRKCTKVRYVVLFWTGIIDKVYFRELGYLKTGWTCSTIDRIHSRCCLQTSGHVSRSTNAES